MRERWNNLLAILLVLTIIYSLSLTIWTYNSIAHLDEKQFHTGQASGVLSLCINQPPQISVSSCSPNATQGTTYLCQVNATDNQTGPVNITVQAISVSRNFDAGTGLPFNISNGANINFTPSNSDVGNYTFNISTDDESGCFNSNTTINFTINVQNTNDAPILYRNISNINFSSGETVFISMGNFFSDPDLDALNFTVSTPNSTEITIDSEGLVRIRSSTCGYTDVVIFTAFDPYNLSADSNAITITCIETTTTPTTPSSSGGGGGGGGGASQLCQAQFECYDYHMCNVTNQKLRKCVDIKGCRDEEFITVACVFQPPKICIENWTCSEWEACLPENRQYRNCIDSNVCGTNLTKPPIMQQCEYIGTCTDGIKNCHDGACEEDIDCGGTCNACQSVQVPYPFEDEPNRGISWLMWLLIILLTSILTYHYFRKEIKAALAKFGWLMLRRRKKQFLITIDDQRKIMTSIEGIEKSLLASQTKEEVFEAINKLASLMKFYFTQAMLWKGELETSQIKEILQKKKGRIIPVLREIFLSMNTKMLECLKEESLATKQNASLLIEEMRNITLQTSDYKTGDYPREVQEIKPVEKDTFLEKMNKKIMNAYIAMQFTELEVAKKIYIELLSDYEKISISEEDIIFKDLKRLYDNINYVNSWIKQ